MYCNNVRVFHRFSSPYKQESHISNVIAFIKYSKHNIKLTDKTAKRMSTMRIV